MFKDYYESVTKNRDRLYHNYLGISRKEFPKWQGWKIINRYRELGIDVKEISDNTLNVHVYNFHYRKFLEEKYTTW